MEDDVTENTQDIQDIEQNISNNKYCIRHLQSVNYSLSNRPPNPLQNLWGVGLIGLIASFGVFGAIAGYAAYIGAAMKSMFVKDVFLMR